MKAIAAIALSLASLASQAGTPQQITQTYLAEAVNQQPAFTASATRGEAFFRQRFAINDKMPACASCHTDDPRQAGQHAVTGKSIRPLATVANGDRFTDPAKVEKWFGRNCKEVVGRLCTPAEKADFITFLSEVR